MAVDYPSCGTEQDVKSHPDTNMPSSEHWANRPIDYINSVSDTVAANSSVKDNRGSTPKIK